MQKARRPKYSELYPLPPDYGDLTVGGKRLARVNACSLRETPEDAVWALAFFDRHYLQSLPLGIWYDDPWYPSPPAHYQFIDDINRYPRNVQIWPRGGGKSKRIKTQILLWMLTWAWMKLLLVKSMDDFVHDDFEELKFQITDNPRIVDDFGKLKSKRGEGKWSDHRIHLTNGFKLAGRSVTSKLLGFRPKFVVCDDAEFDPAMRVSPQILTENFRYLWFGHIVPMLRQGCSALLLGTMNRRDSFCYHMATAHEADEPRVAFFNRVVWAVRDPHTGEYFWPDLWNAETIPLLRAEIGEQEFKSMYMNDPGSPDEGFLPLHSKLNYYSVSDEDFGLANSPMSSDVTMYSWRKVRDENGDMSVERCERSYSEAVKGMYRLILADPIRSASVRSDFAYILVLGIDRRQDDRGDRRDDWYVLDAKMGKPKDTEFIRWIWVLGCKWAVRVVGVESCSTQKQLVAQTDMALNEMALEHGWRPRVVPIKYTSDFIDNTRASSAGIGKANRIAQLAWRFEQGKIKLPRYRTKENAQAINELEYQIQNFTRDLKLLPHDDAIDTLAMAPFCVRPAGRYTPRENRREDAMSLLAQGHVYFPGTHIPIMASLNMSELTPEAEQGIELRRFKEQKTDAHRRRSCRGVFRTGRSRRAIKYAVVG